MNQHVARVHPPSKETSRMIGSGLNGTCRPDCTFASEFQSSIILAACNLWIYTWSLSHARDPRIPPGRWAWNPNREAEDMNKDPEGMSPRIWGASCRSSSIGQCCSGRAGCESSSRHPGQMSPHFEGQTRRRSLLTWEYRKSWSDSQGLLPYTVYSNHIVIDFLLPASCSPLPWEVLRDQAVLWDLFVVDWLHWLSLGSIAVITSTDGSTATCFSSASGWPWEGRSVHYSSPWALFSRGSPFVSSACSFISVLARQSQFSGTAERGRQFDRFDFLISKSWESSGSFGVDLWTCSGFSVLHRTQVLWFVLFHFLVFGPRLYHV